MGGGGDRGQGGRDQKARGEWVDFPAARSSWGIQVHAALIKKAGARPAFRKQLLLTPTYVVERGTTVIAVAGTIVPVPE